MRRGSSIQWSAYPALLCAGAVAVGVASDSVLNTASLLWWGGGVGAGLVLFAGAQWWDRTRLVSLSPLGRVIAVVLVGVSAGGLRHSMYWAPSPRSVSPIAATSEEPVALRGFVADAPKYTGEATRFTLRVDRVFGADDTSAVDGNVRVTLQPSPWDDDVGPFPEVHQGDVLKLDGALRRPPGLRNPGGFDYRAYLARRGMCCTMYVNEPRHVTVRGNRRSMIGRLLMTTRQHIRQQIHRFVPSSGGRAVLQALLLGDRSRITDDQEDRFAETGLMHLLAVSGLHVFLVGMVLYVLLQPLLIRFRMRWQTVEISRAVLTVVVLCFYMLLTGARPSVVRATIMATLLIGGVIFQRSAHPLNTLGVAALILLCIRPPALFDVGFQLSMGAVAAIVTLNPRLLQAVSERYRSTELANWLISSVTVSTAAILGTAPVLLYHFGWVSAAGLLLNTVGIPCTGLALSAAIVMVACGGVWTLAGAAFGSAADLFVRGLLTTSQYGAEWFWWAGLRMASPDPWVLGTFLLGLVALAQWPRPRHRWRCLIAGLLLATISVWGNVAGRDAGPTLDVIFFDVGQGDAALVVTPEKNRVLVDTGPRSPMGAAAESSVIPYLKRRGIQRLDAVVVTHPDEDHLGGLPTLLREVDVNRVVHNGQPADTDLYEDTQRLLDSSTVAERVVQQGDTLLIGESVRVQVLGPPPHPSRRGIESRNGASVVLHFAYGSVDVLLPGDVEATAERNLVRTYPGRLSSSLVKLPHHGSSTSSTPTFVRAVTRDVQGGHAVVSVGRSAQYGMPSEEVLDRWRAQEASLHSTVRSGAVWFRSDGDMFWEVSWK